MWKIASHIDIANFNDGTSLVSLKDKLVNISDDVDAIYLEKSKTLKTLASGNTISDREIYGKPVEIKNTATLIFTANELPVFKDKTNGLIRRLVIIPFNNIVKEIIPNLSELLSTDSAKSYLLNLGLNGIKRIYDNNLELSKCETINQATMQYHLDTDSVRAFINERPKIINVPIRDVYDNYVKFTQSCNKQIVSSNVFSRRLNALGFTSKPTNINGKTTRVFIVKRSN